MKKTTLLLFISFFGIQCINAQELTICNSGSPSLLTREINVSGGTAPYTWHNRLICGDITNQSDCESSGTCQWVFGQCLVIDSDAPPTWILIANGTTATFNLSVGDIKVIDAVGNELIFNPSTVETECSNLGIDNNSIFSNVSIFPNPNEGVVNINFGDLKNINLKVVNPIGIVIYQKENINESIHQFELEEASGIYFIELNSELGMKSYKLIIH